MGKSIPEPTGTEIDRTPHSPEGSAARLGEAEAIDRTPHSPEGSAARLGEAEAIEAAVFRRLVQHFQSRSDVQNIDVMNLAGFCRNCLAKWYRAAAHERGVELTDPEARELIYGMPYDDWKRAFQK